MAKLAKSLMAFRNTGKVPKLKVEKSQIVLIFVLDKSLC